jgi:hypothetical protein
MEQILPAERSIACVAHLPLLIVVTSPISVPLEKAVEIETAYCTARLMAPG